MSRVFFLIIPRINRLLFISRQCLGLTLWFCLIEKHCERRHSIVLFEQQAAVSLLVRNFHFNSPSKRNQKRSAGHLQKTQNFATTRPYRELRNDICYLNWRFLIDHRQCFILSYLCCWQSSTATDKKRKRGILLLEAAKQGKNMIIFSKLDLWMAKKRWYRS